MDDESKKIIIEAISEWMQAAGVSRITAANWVRFEIRDDPDSQANKTATVTIDIFCQK